MFVSSVQCSYIVLIVSRLLEVQTVLSPPHLLKAMFSQHISNFQLSFHIYVAICWYRVFKFCYESIVFISIHTCLSLLFCICCFNRLQGTLWIQVHCSHSSSYILVYGVIQLFQLHILGTVFPKTTIFSFSVTFRQP